MSYYPKQYIVCPLDYWFFLHLTTEWKFVLVNQQNKEELASFLQRPNDCKQVLLLAKVAMEKKWNASSYGSLFHTNFHTGSYITVEIVFYLHKEEILSKGHNLDIALQENILSQRMSDVKENWREKQKCLLVSVSSRKYIFESSLVDFYCLH